VSLGEWFASSGKTAVLSSSGSSTMTLKIIFQDVRNYSPNCKAMYTRRLESIRKLNQPKLNRILSLKSTRFEV
jgi:hypothetical protein